MIQQELFDVPSPCINICQSNEKGYCIGCYRSRNERFYWNQYNNEQKKHVLKLCIQRKYRIMKQKIKNHQDNTNQNNTNTSYSLFDFNKN